MSKKPGNPYQVLYWMGGALLLLLLGVLALVLLAPPKIAAPPDPERTLLYLYSKDDPTGPAAAVVIEESRGRATLLAIPFAVPPEVRKAFAGTNSKTAQDMLSTAMQHKLHHRVFLPHTIVATLVDAAGGITVEGRVYTGPEAIAYINGGGDQSARRAGLVMLALAGAASSRGVNMGLSQGLALARQVDTDMDLTALPDILSRWSSYASPRVEITTTNDPAALGKLLLPDPAGGQK
ncbi:MAG TPA: hypothetical protein VGK74_26900 [Symbiobacteriaceae bacterium]